MGVVKVMNEFKQSKERSLQEIGFHISRELTMNSEAFPQGEFLVDNVSKRFAIRYIESTKTNNPFALFKYKIILRVFQYSDLGLFELIEDGNTVTSGRGAATAAGALTFGLAGALVGSSGKRKTENTCCHMTVRMLMNDPQSPQINIDFISSEVTKKSILYKEKQKQAQELDAMLHYIASNS